MQTEGQWGAGKTGPRRGQGRPHDTDGSGSPLALHLSGEVNVTVGAEDTVPASKKVSIQ